MIYVFDITKYYNLEATRQGCEHYINQMIFGHLEIAALGDNQVPYAD